MITVIIPTFNSERFIYECINSVITQSFANFELIIIDNFSQDSTLKIIEDFNDPRIRVYQIKNSGIIARSRNLGIQKANGKFLAFLDSDDTWNKKKLETCVGYLSIYPVVCHPMVSDKRNFRKQKERDISFKKLFTNGNIIFTSSIMINRDIVGTNISFSESQELITIEDYDLWLTLLKKGYKIFEVPELLGYYRTHSSNSSNRTSYKKSMSKLIEKYKKRVQRKEYILRRILFYYELASFDGKKNIRSFILKACHKTVGLFLR